MCVCLLFVSQSSLSVSVSLCLSLLSSLSVSLSLCLSLCYLCLNRLSVSLFSLCAVCLSVGLFPSSTLCLSSLDLSVQSVCLSYFFRTFLLSTSPIFFLGSLCLSLCLCLALCSLIQDERVMQLFSLINTLLGSHATTAKQHLEIRVSLFFPYCILS